MLHKLFANLFYALIYYSTRFLRMLLVPCRISGMENIPKKGGFILACNHLSNLDPPLIGCLIPRVVSFVAKESLSEVPVVGFLLKNLDTVFIKRESADFRALRGALKRLQRGRPLVIFPEGSREAVRRAANRGDQVYSGIGFLVAKSGVPVIPVKLSGTDKAMPIHAKWPRRYPVSVTIGKPQTFSSEDLYPQISYRIMTAISALE